MYRVSFILGDCVFTEMKCTKQSVIGVHPCSFTGNEIYKTEKHVGKNTIYSNTRTLIGQKNFPDLRLTDKTFFSG